VSDRASGMSERGGKDDALADAAASQLGTDNVLRRVGDFGHEVAVDVDASCRARVVVHDDRDGACLGDVDKELLERLLAQRAGKVACACRWAARQSWLHRCSVSREEHVPGAMTMA